ncbi:MAG: hypothetical protein FWE40_01115 [Oscillospiraceae bacterium]|nr:hypothetical protein [Oscillospiraceae bacterium]
MKKLIVCILLLALLAVPASAATVAAGVNHSLVIANNGTVWAWGRNTHGQLGDGTRFTRNAAVRVDISDVVAVAAGNGHTVALRDDGTVWSWGRNDLGQLGDGTTTERLSPVQVDIDSVIAISTHDTHTVALRDDGTVWSWGDHLRWDNTAQLTPIMIDIDDVIAIRAGWGYTLALRADETVWGWGLINDSDLPAPLDLDWPTDEIPQMDGLDDIVAFAEHGQFVAVTADGAVWAWDYGEEPAHVRVQGVRFMHYLHLYEVTWPWWAHLPAWQQWLLRWIFFGWAWM